MASVPPWRFCSITMSIIISITIVIIIKMNINSHAGFAVQRHERLEEDLCHLNRGCL